MYYIFCPFELMFQSQVNRVGVRCALPLVEIITHRAYVGLRRPELIVHDESTPLLRFIRTVRISFCLDLFLWIDQIKSGCSILVLI